MAPPRVRLAPLKITVVALLMAPVVTDPVPASTVTVPAPPGTPGTWILGNVTFPLVLTMANPIRLRVPVLKVMGSAEEVKVVPPDKPLKLVPAV